MGDYGAIFEGGITATASLLVKQITELGIQPERIKYVVLTHTHPDHAPFESDRRFGGGKTTEARGSRQRIPSGRQQHQRKPAHPG